VSDLWRVRLRLDQAGEVPIKPLLAITRLFRCADALVGKYLTDQVAQDLLRIFRRHAIQDTAVYTLRRLPPSSAPSHQMPGNPLRQPRGLRRPPPHRRPQRISVQAVRWCIVVQRRAPPPRRVLALAVTAQSWECTRALVADVSHLE
jgi:hypothetical protein